MMRAIASISYFILCLTLTFCNIFYPNVVTMGITGFILGYGLKEVLDYYG